MSGIRKAAKLARTCAVVSILLVAWASLMPDRQATEIEQLPVINALAHVIMHFIVTVCVMTGWHDRLSKALPLAALIAIGMEVGQIIVPGREFDMIELAGNLLGFGLGWAFFLSLRRFSRHATL
ncbi:VanZ family protein [Amaricoccus macauensis]|uniref:VanZ family protein n=1 Tax=Amaricoccus macauensis TaxID=57001 RepID=UPI003C7D109E